MSIVHVRIVRWDKAAFRAATLVLAEEGVRPDDVAHVLDGKWFPVCAGKVPRLEAVAARLGSIPGVGVAVSE